MTRVVLASLLILFLASCSGSPTYEPSVEVLATREAERYARAVQHNETLWRIGISVLIALAAIVVVASAYLARVGYRLQAARAAMLEAEVRRKRLVSLGDGKVLELLPDEDGAGVIHGVSYNAPPEVMPAQVADWRPQPYQPTMNDLGRFVLECAAILRDEGGWQATRIPRYNAWSEHGYSGMTAERWVAITDELARMGLIVKEHGKPTEVASGNNLQWLHASLG